jgi:hypothetical protein
MSEVTHLNDVNETYIAAVIRAENKGTHTEVLTYYGEGLAVTFNVESDPRLKDVKAGDMVYYSSVYIDETGKEHETPIGNHLKNGRIFIREELSNNGFYAKLKR